jgi:hypothetical protein
MISPTPRKLVGEKYHLWAVVCKALSCTWRCPSRPHPWPFQTHEEKTYQTQPGNVAKQRILIQYLHSKRVFSQNLGILLAPHFFEGFSSHHLGIEQTTRGFGSDSREHRCTDDSDHPKNGAPVAALGMSNWVCLANVSPFPKDLVFLPLKISRETGLGTLQNTRLSLARNV